MATKNLEKKSIFVPRLPNSKAQPPFEGSINGRDFVLPRGVVSEVDAAVYEIVERSLQAEVEAEDYYNNLQATLIQRAREEAQLLK